MAEKRKDKNGKVLEKNESQKANGVYQYRYIDTLGKRRATTSPTLDGLRKKEKEIERALANGINWNNGNITVNQLVDSYIDLIRSSDRHGTVTTYQCYSKTIQRHALGAMRINRVKNSDGLRFVNELHTSGSSYNTIETIMKLIRAAFRMAVKDDILLKVPFQFTLSKILSNNAVPRAALTEEQAARWLDFLKHDNVYSKYYDLNVVLLYTGMRVSEFCGLTISDLDFENKCIYIRRQLLKKSGGIYYTGEPKTPKGKRRIAMSNAVFHSLQCMIRRRKCDEEFVVDGHSRFLMLTRNNTPFIAQNIETIISNAYAKYCALYPDNPLPHITPHVFRHTLGTQLLQNHMSPKNIEAVMGHNIRETWEVYAHPNTEQACQQMAEIIDLGHLKEQVRATV